MKFTRIFLLGCMLTFVFQSNGQCCSLEKSSKKLAFNEIDYAQTGILEIVAGLEDLSVFSKSIRAADLENVLKESEAFTVIAPTNIAFAKLPDETLMSLSKSESKGKLVNILICHLIKRKMMISDVVAAIKANNGTFEMKTINGNALIAYLKGDRVLLKYNTNGVATIIKTDMEASNGVIHVIDTVVLPE